MIPKHVQSHWFSLCTNSWKHNLIARISFCFTFTSEKVLHSFIDKHAGKVVATLLRKMLSCCSLNICPEIKYIESYSEFVLTAFAEYDLLRVRTKRVFELLCEWYHITWHITVSTTSTLHCTIEYTWWLIFQMVMIYRLELSCQSNDNETEGKNI